MNEIGVIILAAGSSSRLGHSKQLLEYDGETLLRRSVRAALSISKHTATVLGADFKNHKLELHDLETQVVFNLDWKKGMGNSLKYGLNHLHHSFPALDGVIVMVCDQPYVDSDHLNKLIEAFSNGNNLVASSYNNTLGVPALFARQYFKELLKIDDEKGAKPLIEEHGAHTVAFPNGAMDIDTDGDWKALKNK